MSAAGATVVAPAVRVKLFLTEALIVEEHSGDNSTIRSGRRQGRARSGQFTRDFQGIFPFGGFISSDRFISSRRCLRYPQ